MKYTIQLDLCTICQLNCLSCPMRKRNYGEIKPGYVKFDTFKKFVDKNINYIKKMEISNYGEPFLNPEIIDILKYANSINLPLYCYNGCNFNTISDDLIKALVDYNFRYISFSIDGASQDSYSKYRVNGNFDTVILNIKKLLAYKTKKNAAYPILRWQYVIRESTDSIEEIRRAKKLANELGIELKFKPTWERNYICKNESEVKEETGLTKLSQIEEKSVVDSKISSHAFHDCLSVFRSDNPRLTINWDGRFLACCGNVSPDNNLNLFETSISELKNNKYWISIINFLSNKDYEFDTCCSRCKCGKALRESGLFDCELKKLSNQ